MKVEVWSDYACPFCYIGKKRFEHALQEFKYKEQVSIIFKSFQLDPYSPKDQNEDVHMMLSKKYKMSYEQAKLMNEQVIAQAKEVGLDYQFDTMILTNTFAAHRLSHYAKQQGKMTEMIERLLKAYFIDSLHIGEYETLAELAGEIGLDKQEALRILTEGEFSEDVHADQDEARQLGVSGVPFFVFNRKYAVSGAQSSEAFLEVLEKTWQEEQTQPLQILNEQENPKGDKCTEDQCEF